jgi:hypothetical protein
VRASQIVCRAVRHPPRTGRCSFPEGKPGNLPEMDGGIRQNPAYRTARPLVAFSLQRTAFSTYNKLKAVR